MIDLSVVILSYNTKELLTDCLTSLKATFAKDPHLTFETIVIDNSSTDGSQYFIQELPKKQGNWTVATIINKKNVGFGKANNQAAAIAKGKYLLLLNSDTKLMNIRFSELIQFFEDHKRVGVVTVKVVLPDGQLDPACHRGYPTLWRSLSYFSKLEKVSYHIPILNRLFGGYHLTYLDLQKNHEIDTPSGAFYLTTKHIFDEVGGFDETFFMYGEDIDLSFRIKQAGYAIWYYPHQQILHIKGQSGMKQDNGQVKSSTKKHFYDAMKIFYNKHYIYRYPKPLTRLVNWYLDKKIRSL